MALLTVALPPRAAFAGTEVCHQIHAGEGWQDTAFPEGMVTDVFTSGAWTAADGLHDPVGASGHLNLDANRVTDSAAHGALLFEVSLGNKTHQGSWAQFKTMLDQAGTFHMDSAENGARLRFRINEPDAALTDNAGALTVCMRYAD